MTTAQHRLTRSVRDDAVPDDTRIVGTIDRRVLCNYRVDPAAVRRFLPDGLRPAVRNGWAIAGVCLLRTTGLRPTWVPSALGRIASWGGENAAHRIAVEWDGPDGVRTGVWIPERYSASRVPVVLGGRVVPGVHRFARFDIDETDDRFRVAFEAPGAEVDVDVELAPESAWRSSVFDSVDDASEHFRTASVGWSPGLRDGRVEGLELRSSAWSIRPAIAHRIRSSFIDDLPRGSAEFDDVLVMRRVPITWTMPRWDTAGPA